MDELKIHEDNAKQILQRRYEELQTKRGTAARDSQVPLMLVSAAEERLKQLHNLQEQIAAHEQKSQHLCVSHSKTFDQVSVIVCDSAYMCMPIYASTCSLLSPAFAV